MIRCAIAVDGRPCGIAALVVVARPAGPLAVCSYDLSQELYEEICRDRLGYVFVNADGREIGRGPCSCRPAEPSLADLLRRHYEESGRPYLDALEPSIAAART